MLNVSHCLAVIASSLLLAISCQNQTDTVAAKDSNLEPCDPQRKTIKVAESVKGRVTTLDMDHQDVWVIVSEQGIIGESKPVFDGPDIIIPCNMPDSLKKYELRVIFSGDLKEAQTNLPSGNSKLYYSPLKSIKSTAL